MGILHIRAFIRGAKLEGKEYSHREFQHHNRANLQEKSFACFVFFFSVL